MIYLEAPKPIQSLPDEIVHDSSFTRVFLAGGITNCRDWQAELGRSLALFDDLVVMNPRRENFPMDDPTAAREQIEWEFNHLRAADVIAFWFSNETVQPITLFELGSWLVQEKPLVIGVDPAYERRQDVVIQTELARPGLKIHSSLDSLARGILRAT